MASRSPEPASVSASASASSLPLEPLRWWDIPAVTELEGVLFPTDSPWTAEMFWAELAADGRHYVVHRDPVGAVIGYAGLATNSDESEVQTIGVHPAARGRGIGRALLADLLQVAADRPVLLEVRTDNEPAISLYESTGFARLGLRRHYYQPSGADAYTMRRPAPADRTRNTDEPEAAP